MPPRLQRFRTLVVPFVLVLAVSAPCATAHAEDPKPAPPLSIAAIRLEPASPAPDTLCHLALTLKNGGDRTASRFAFRVTVGGRELPAYRGRVFLATLPPRGTLELPLYNFWSTEPKRPAPAGGKLTLEVTLLDARWVEAQSVAGSSAGSSDNVETWKPVAPEVPIAGLPLSRTLEVVLQPVPKQP